MSKDQGETYLSSKRSVSWAAADLIDFSTNPPERRETTGHQVCDPQNEILMPMLSGKLQVTCVIQYVIWGLS